MKDNDEIMKFIDEYLNSHEVDSRDVLGQGGQGIVYRTTDGCVALKLALENGEKITDVDKIESFKKSIKKLLYLQLPKNVNVSIPLAVLKDDAGYVMKMLNTARSFEFFSQRNMKFRYLNGYEDNLDAYGVHLEQSEEIQAEEKSENSECKERESLENHLFKYDSKNNLLVFDPKVRNKSLFVRYAFTGGVRLRTLALGKAAVEMSKLHSRGLVYGDISDKNVYFVADDDEKCTVWYIDADNLDYEKKKGVIVYTPKYGAPELVQNVDGIRTVSDCFAFSVLVSHVLTWCHPFEGKRVFEVNGDDFDSDEIAYRGELPWIFDPDDTSNYYESPLPHKFIYTSGIFRLLKLTFCEGRTHSFARPSMYYWGPSLVQAHDITVKCAAPKCGMTMYFNPDASGTHKCECCDNVNNNQQLLCLKAFRLTAKGYIKDPEWIWVREVDFNSNHSILELPARIFEPFDTRTFDDTFLKIIVKASNIIVRYCAYSSSEIYIASAARGGRFTKLSNYVLAVDDLRKDKNIWLMCVTSNGYHRLITMSLKEAGNETV